MNYNLLILGGNLTRDVELTYLPSQTPVANFGIAVNRSYMGKDGNKKEEVLFIDCQSFGETANNIAKFFSKGRPILITGRLKLDTWQAADGAQHSKHRMVVERFTFVDSKPQQDQQPTAPEAAPPAFDDGSIPF